MRRFFLSGFFLAAASVLPAAAQDRGGVGLLPEALAVGGPRGLARPLLSAFPSVGASDLQSLAMPTAAERSQRHQNMIARLRGDGGFLDGFSFGQPLAASRQRPIPVPGDPPPFVEQIFAPTFNRTVNRTFNRNRTIVRNNFEAPVAVTVGNNNLVQQQGASSGGTNAQQQVANIGGRGRQRGGGATNIAMPSGPAAQPQGLQSGANAQQQVVTIGDRHGQQGGGASNLVTPSGSVLQQAQR
jgi:hypothetical protein